ncbi:unnamed protein product [Rhizoctonia solani]|uniref:Plastocyanin-like domain-containing protein n=1 Tax=Rhizoctonia solani TaxID=456999 RepID=A0A8H3A084_9AGAM|nr:unnamed protein product [Rhizoctonia solani]
MKVNDETLPVSKNPWIDYAGNTINGGTDLVQANLSPFPDNAPPQGKANFRLPLNVTRTGEFGWATPGRAPPVNFTPLLLQPAQIAALDNNVYFSYPNGSVVDIIFTFLGSGEGKFPHASIKDAVDAGYKSINMKNTPLRDDFVTAAVCFRALNLGPMIIHCHIDVHLATGMVIVLLEGAEKLTNGYVPNYYRDKNKP